MQSPHLLGPLVGPELDGGPLDEDFSLRRGELERLSDLANHRFAGVVAGDGEGAQRLIDDFPRHTNEALVRRACHAHSQPDELAARHVAGGAIQAGDGPFHTTPLEGRHLKPHESVIGAIPMIAVMPWGACFPAVELAGSWSRS